MDKLGCYFACDYIVRNINFSRLEFIFYFIGALRRSLEHFTYTTVASIMLGGTGYSTVETHDNPQVMQDHPTYSWRESQNEPDLNSLVRDSRVITPGHRELTNWSTRRPTISIRNILDDAWVCHIKACESRWHYTRLTHLSYYFCSFRKIAMTNLCSNAKTLSWTRCIEDSEF